MKRQLFIVLLCFFSVFTANAEGIGRLKELCMPGKIYIPENDLFIEGVVISDYRSENVAVNPNLTHSFVDIGVNDRTAYIQESDGSIGIRLLFTSPVHNRLERYDHVRLNLTGCTVERHADPDMITVSGLKSSNVLGKTSGVSSDIKTKERGISELTDADIFTEVTLKDVDVACKNGCWTNIYEAYSQYCHNIHQSLDYVQNKRMDSWATLMRDVRGDCIYLMVNTLCPWRRDGNVLPQGLGDVRAVVVSENLRRYGGDMGRYSIRPMYREDIQLSGKASSTPWKTICGWEYDGLGGQFITFEKLGVQGGVWRDGKVGDRVVSDRGDGTAYLWTDSGSSIHIDGDLDALDALGKGYQINGALYFKSATKNWYSFNRNGQADGVKSILVEFSTSGLSGDSMRLFFSWAAGDQNADNNYGFPAQWKVECSTDGISWKELKETATGNTTVNLRPLPFWDKKIRDGRNVPTSYDAALGMQQRGFSIPKEAFGRDRVLVKISPASDTVFYLGDRFDEPAVGKEYMTADKDEYVTMIRLGNLIIDYK